MPRTRIQAVSMLLAVLALAPAVARAGELQGRTESFASGDFQQPGGGCRDDVRIFRSLRDGDFDFCREKLGYVPGRADCLRVVTTTCTTVAFDGISWVPQSLVNARTERITCPRGPVPPSCPAGIAEPLD